MNDQTRKAEGFHSKRVDIGNEEVDMQDQIRELALTNALTDAFLILQELRDLKMNLSLELQAVRDNRRAEAKEWAEFMAEHWATLRKIQTQFRIDATLLHLIKPQKAGEKKWQKNEGESHSSQSRMLKQFAENTR